jgi:hypothetical protein
MEAVFIIMMMTVSNSQVGRLRTVSRMSFDRCREAAASYHTRYICTRNLVTLKRDLAFLGRFGAP